MDWSSIYEQVADKLTGWVEAGVTMFPNAVVALVIVLAAWVVSGWIARATRSGFDRVVDNVQLTSLLTRVLRVAILTAAVFVALGVLNLDKTVTSLLAGVGVVGIALGFAFQDIAANFMAGTFMAVQRPIRIGDLVNTNDFLGVVEHIDLRATQLRTVTGELVRIPNKDVFGKPVTNYTETPERRVDVSCGVSYGDDLEAVERIVLAALEDLPKRAAGRDMEVVWTGFGGSSIDFSVRVWIDTAKQNAYLGTQSAIIKRIKAAFDADGITIPFPIRTLDFGILGGKPLDAVLSDSGFGNGSVTAEAK